MMLRPYQQDILDQIIAHRAAGGRSALVVSPTGSGKSRMIGELIRHYSEPSCVVAHRVEICLQLSMALARSGVIHDLVAPKNTLDFIISHHISTLGRSMIAPNHPIKVAAVDTLNARADQYRAWAASCGIFTLDEAHHGLQDNKWGQAKSMFPRAFDPGFTATPNRLDGRSLHIEEGGFYEHVIMGPQVRELIEQGYLCPLRIHWPGQNAPDKATIVGDPIETYKRRSLGEKAIGFFANVRAAHEWAERFTEAGIPAQAVSGKSSDAERQRANDMFASGELMALFNVDLFGEGYDIPEASVAILMTRTESSAKFRQMCGRVIRPAEGKKYGLINDHAGNLFRHAPPDDDFTYVLRQGSGGAVVVGKPKIPVTICTECALAYKATMITCPYCGEPRNYTNEERRDPKRVHGDLVEFDRDMWKALRAEAKRIEKVPKGRPRNGRPRDWAVLRMKRERRDAQAGLKEAFTEYRTAGRAAGWFESDREMYRRFYFEFNRDMLSALTMSAREMNELSERVRGYSSPDNTA